jgi:alpha-amylase/alpha-mannosidase (GH57 family)
LSNRSDPARQRYAASESPRRGPQRYVCVHGHFYQPPREDPTTGRIEPQPSAEPYADWNERINAECYAPNAQARILDDAGAVARRVNNYTRISFNFGPTLLTWLATADPTTYRAVLRADRESQRRYSGHGSALAQAYNHAILPLCNDRDRRTQVIWGIEDFRFRFGRHPEGLWLPEAAVDLQSLELLAQYGIRFTLLSPAQASQFRSFGDSSWIDAAEGRIDPRRPYRLQLPSGRTLDLFFYDGPISQAIAFEHLLSSGDALVERLLAAHDDRTNAQLVHVATDGESYGHHHAHGEMALAYALFAMETGNRVELTNYGEFLERFPPRHEVRIVEPSSWSCHHGVERWSTACGCGADSPDDLRWRAPLRAALDWLRDRLITIYEEHARRHLHDPWNARDDYIRVVLDADPSRVSEFFAKHGRCDLDDQARSETLALLEMQRHALLMYTSCGWFFEDLARIETVQILRYADRALQIARELSGESLEPEFVELLGRAPSSDPEIADGAQLYRLRVQTAGRHRPGR